MNMHTQERGHVKTQQESGHLEAKEKGFQTCRHLDPEFPASMTVRK